MRSAPILLLDDDQVVLDILPEMLLRRSPSLSIEALSSPEEAIIRIDGKDHAVIVTDLRMPRMNGLNFLEVAKKRQPTTPVVLMTGHADLSLVDHALALGAYDILPKPLDARELFEVVESARQTKLFARRAHAVQLTLNKWKERFRHLERSLQERDDRSVSHLRDEAKRLVLSSRRLSNQSLATIGRSIDRLQRLVHINEQKLETARQQVAAEYERHRRLAVARFTRA